MARTVADVALLLTAMAGVDDADPSGAGGQRKIAADYATFLKADALEGQALWRAAAGDGVSPGRRRRRSTKAIDAIKAAGAEVIDVKIADLQRLERRRVRGAAVRVQGRPEHVSEEERLAARLARSADRLEQGERRQVMPFFGQEIFEQAQAKGPLTDAAYRQGARRRAAARRARTGCSPRSISDKLDALIAPSLSPAWPTDHVLGDHFVGAGYGMAAVAGTPSITVPVGDSHGLPLGVTFMGRAYSEGELIGFGFALGQATKARKAPQFKPTLAPKYSVTGTRASGASRLLSLPSRTTSRWPGRRSRLRLPSSSCRSCRRR